jgi:hypothetical protein
LSVVASGQIIIQVHPHTGPMISPRTLNLPVTRPATQPVSQQPATTSRGQMREWITQLGDPDPDIRQAATANLMLLHRADLPVLRQEADAQMPLIPEQIVRLHEIVIQGYLSDETYDYVDKGFLGLSWNVMETEQQFPEIDEGVLVADRIPGFSSCRMLQRGDILVGLADPPRPFHSVTDLVIAVSMSAPGTTVWLDVLRNGKHIQVPVVLEHKPAQLETNETSLVEWVNARQDKAEAYWRSAFPEFAAQYRGPDPIPTHAGSI